jgi:hypothetical protein
MFDLARFQKVIRNRVLWSIFLIIIIFSFVFTYSPNADQTSLLDRGSGVAGEVNGRQIQLDEYQVQSFFHERSRFAAPNEGEDRTEEVLARIAQLDLADQAGLRVSNQELQSMVGNAEIFRNEQGGFEPRAFQFYLMQEKWPSEATFFDFSRQEGKLFKLFEMATGGARLISPADLRDAYDRDFARYTLEYARMPRELAGTNAVEVTDAMIEAYYQDNPQEFRRPEEARARYFTITVQDAFNTNLVSEAEARAYYDEKLATEFTRPVPRTNATESTTAALEMRQVPFEEARVGIVMRLGFGKAMEKVQESAASLYDQMLPRRGFQHLSFEEVQASLGIPATTTEYFTIQQPLPGIDVGLSFNQAVFNLGTNEVDRLAEPLVSSNRAYVVQLLDRRPERVQPLDEVRDLARLRAQVKANNERTLAKAKELHAAVAAAIQGGAAFSNAVATVGLTATNAPPFTRAGGEANAIPGFFQILGSLDAVSPGDLLEPVVTGDSAILARVVSIDAADSAGFEERKGQYQGVLTQRRRTALLRDFQEAAKQRVKVEPKPAEDPAS